MVVSSRAVCLKHQSTARQSQIFEREGLDLERSTLADWVGKSTALLEPLVDAIGQHVLAGQAIFADDTPVKMLAPGTGKTATARLWAYGQDERPWKALSRLCKRFRHLSRAGKPQPRVLAAIARELSGFIWDIARKTPLPA